MTRIAIIDGHPDPDSRRYVHALAQAYADGASGKHEVRRIVLAELDFPLLRTAHDWQQGKPPRAIKSAQDSIQWAEHIVLLYPLWLGDIPALLKAFLEQVARPGFAIGPMGKGLPKKLLKGRSARVIVTMGMPAPFYRFFYRAHSLKSLERNILSFVGLGPIRHSIIGSVESSDKRRAGWIEQVRALGSRAR
jgi:putative NADPH-quinone reductase